MSTDKPQHHSSPRSETGSSPEGHSIITARRIASETLMAGQRELIIQHGEEEYRLSITSKGKLILTK